MPSVAWFIMLLRPEGCHALPPPLNFAIHLIEFRIAAVRVLKKKENQKSINNVFRNKPPGCLIKPSVMGGTQKAMCGVCVCVRTESWPWGSGTRVHVWLREGIKDLIKWILSLRAPNIMFSNE